MSGIRVSVTAEHIAACAIVPDIGDGYKSTHPESKDPIELAIAEATGQSVACDQDVPDGEMATIGNGHTVLVNNLPDEVAEWIDRYYKGETVEPFDFSIEIEDWLVDLILGDRPLLTLREAATALGIQPVTLRGSPTIRRLRAVKLGRDWFVNRIAVEHEVTRRKALSE